MKILSNPIQSNWIRLSFFLFSFLSLNNLNAQFTQQILSELWVKPGGQGIAVKSTTTTNANRNVYVAGSTLVGPNNSDIIIQKFQPDGALDWQQTYAGLANLNEL